MPITDLSAMPTTLVEDYIRSTANLHVSQERLQDQESPDGESWMDFPLAYSPMPQIAAPIKKMAKFRAVRLIFFQFKV